jgi:hypothetical protein
MKMGQRKLGIVEASRVSEASCFLERVKFDDGGILEAAHSLLLRMQIHGTTDGKPYVEPQPEIGEGYRVATDADCNRLDIEFWGKSDPKWRVRNCAYKGHHISEDYYWRVPIDRTPTDEDARQRPLVMVRDYKGDTWEKATLLWVRESEHYPFLVVIEGRDEWFINCRFPYPGE